MNAVTRAVPATTVENVMTRCPLSVRPGVPFATVAAVLSRNAIGAVPVAGRPVPAPATFLKENPCVRATS